MHSTFFDTLQPALKQALSQLRLEFEIAPQHFLLAVSGGVDSVVLAELFHRSDLHFSIAHFDHGLRSTSRLDAQFVEVLAERLGVKFITRRAEPFVGQGNVEAWAREQRYLFLDQARHELGASVVVTAHHQRDQAETVLHKIFTGRIDVSLQAMTLYCRERLLFRPFLNVEKQIIQASAEELQLPFVQDETNDDLARTRNWIRNEILPRVREVINPQVDSAVSKLADSSRSDEEFLEHLARQHAAGFGWYVSQQEVSKLHVALAWRVLRALAVHRCGERALKVSRGSYLRLLVLLKQGAAEARTVELGFGISADCSQGGVLFYDSRAVSEQEPQLFPYPGIVEFCQYRLQASIVPRAELDELRNDHGGMDSPYVERFDAEVLQGSELVVRNRRDGDVVRVMNRGRRKLKKMFQEQGLMLTLRNRLPIVECDSGILWVPGVARSDLAPVRADTSLVLELTCCNNR